MKAKKSKQANLERLRFPLLLMGLTFSGALVLSAFEWRTFEEAYTEPLGEEVLVASLEDEQVFVAIPEKKPEVVKKKVQRPVIDVIEIVENERPIDVVLELPDLGFEDEPILQDIGFEAEVIAEEEILITSEIMPSFPGGEAEMYRFLGNEVNYPAMAKDAGVEGTVYISFVVSKTGDIRDVKILRGIGAGCDEEVLEAISKMPTWNPGKQKGLPVNVQYNMPFSFTLK